MAKKRCKTCSFWEVGFYADEKTRGKCKHPKVLNHLGDEDDGIQEWEAAETHCGPLFGCIHHKEEGCLR